jgi:assimilatory nitrate reductase catalytic subunit
VAEFARLLLAPDGAAPGPVAPRARQVCQCFGVSEPQIRDCLGALAGAPGERLAALQSALKCGTQCGSCLPELRRLCKGSPALADMALR